jgi:hypothetical protein
LCIANQLFLEKPKKIDSNMIVGPNKVIPGATDVKFSTNYAEELTRLSNEMRKKDKYKALILKPEANSILFPHC